MEDPSERSPWAIPSAVLVGVLIFGGALTAIGIALSPSPAADLWTDLAKAGIQITVITSLGVAVNVTLKSVDDRRRKDEKKADEGRRLDERAADERRRLNDQRLQVFREVVAAYDQVKSVRRNLRALGFLEPTSRLNAGQAQGLREQMMVLNDAQLSLEAVKRQLNESDLFKNRGLMSKQLGIAERYIGDGVHARWEDSGGSIWEGASADSVNTLRLVDFAGHKRDGHTAFETNVSKPLNELTRLLHEELFGEPQASIESST